MVLYIRQATAWRNRRYQEILQEAGSQIASHGYFRKDQVCEKCGYPGDEDTLQWGFIIDWLQDPHGAYGVMTVPVAERFFKERVWSKVADGAPIAIGRYIASGHGKKTVGFVKASFQGGEFLIWKAKHMLAQRNGKTAALNRVIGRARLDPSIDSTIQKQLPRP